MRIPKKNLNKGFTLIEIMVSLMIFSIVAFIAVGALLKIVDANRKSQTLKVTINNINFALESMSRELRVGTNYTCLSDANANNFTLPVNITKSNDCTSWVNSPLSWLIAFYTSSKFCPASTHGLVYAYRFNGTTKTIEKAEQGCDSNNPNNPSTVTTFIPVVSPDLKFDIASIRMETPLTLSTNQASYALFHFKGYSGVAGREKTNTTFDIQTSVTERLSDAL